MNKYHNKITHVDGFRFDSKAEANRWLELKLLQRAGEIADLERQKRFKLQDAFIAWNGEKILAITYVADFVYTDRRTGKTVIEDVKGKKTEVYNIKKKLLLKKYPNIVFHEVTK